LNVNSIINPFDSFDALQRFLQELFQVERRQYSIEYQHVTDAINPNSFATRMQMPTVGQAIASQSFDGLIRSLIVFFQLFILD
jgi:hypothetical protein